MKRPRALAAPLAALAIIASVVSTSAGPAAGAPPIDSSDLQKAVTFEGINEHLEELQDIADANGDTRGTGTTGHDASAEYVAGVMEGLGYHVTLQPFVVDVFAETGPAAFDQVAPNPTVYPRYDGTNGVWYTADYSGSGDVTAEAIAVDFVEPTADPSTSSAGCEASDFGPDTAGKIVLLQRGTCDFGLKAELAEAAGAVGVVLFNEGTIGADDRIGVLIPTLSGYEVNIPVIGLDYATGRQLVDLDAAGPLTLHLEVHGVILEDVTTHNVIADSPGGRADRTVVVGGHLDSVHEGPGINDNGSGTMAMLEIAEEMHELGIEPVNKLRFIFFSAEEQGLLGSEYYVSQLSKRQIKDISVMLNFDMLGSPNFARFVYDGDGSDHGVAGPNGSGVIEQVFADAFESAGLAYETTPFDGRSDYQAFTLAGIPAGGLFSGAEDVKTPEQVALYGGTAGVAYDACYHQACDDIDNISPEGLEQMADAAAHAILTFAMSPSAVQGTAKGSPNSTKPADWKGPRQVR